MIKPIVRHGNARALVLDRALLSVSGIDPMGEVCVTVNGNQIILTPAPRKRPAPSKSPSER